MPLTGRALVQLSAELTSALDLSTTTSPFTKSIQYLIADGAGANQANRIWHDQRTLAASATESLDLADSLTDPFGATITMARIKFLLVQAASGNTNDVHVTRPATNGVPLFLAAGDGLVIRPGGLNFWATPDATGVAVTAGTGDLIAVTNGGAGSSVTYDIVVIGAAS